MKRLYPGMGATERSRLAEALADSFRLPADVPPPALQPYLDELRRLQAIDLDAVIPEFVRRLASDAGLRRQVLGSLAYLFVDEFQDLNESQFALVEILAETARVFAIGDPDQAIYGFRGSDPAFFFRFAVRPGVEQVSLTRNYRCPAAVIEAATALLVSGGRSGRPPLVAESGRQGAIELYRAPTPAAEAEFIVRRIEELMGGIGHFSLASGCGGDGETGHGLGFGDMAVLFRIGRQAEEIASALGRRGIPYQQVGVTPFYLTPEVRHVHDLIHVSAGSAVMADGLRSPQESPAGGKS
jgi:superfamily I DNA/RNA helicase